MRRQPLDLDAVAHGCELLIRNGSRTMEPKKFVLAAWQADALAIDLVMTLEIPAQEARAAVRLEFDVFEPARRPWWKRILRR